MLNQKMLDVSSLGYGKFNTADFEGHEVLLQKTIWSDCDKFKKYFINIKVFDWIDFRERFPNLGRFSYEAEAFLYSNDHEFTVVHRNTIETLDDVLVMEKFFEDVYLKLDCVPDKLNND